uniref:Uncharacterized protein n=1 Tax=Aegilops tauschii subsp. strangulata TaxID=200361 RepID=A0A453BJF3_AEGTS
GSMSRRALATAQAPAEAGEDPAFLEAWKKVTTIIEPPQTPMSAMKPRPPTPASIPSKLTVNFVLPYKSEITNKEVYRRNLPRRPTSRSQICACASRVPTVRTILRPFFLFRSEIRGVWRGAFVIWFIPRDGWNPRGDLVRNHECSLYGLVMGCF